MHIGIKKFIEEFKDFNIAIIGEPTNLNVEIEHKGLIRLKINTKGKCAHGSVPKNGINAIYNMINLISSC